jgi:ABC-type uncharacterized transport system involved in gliding motility auxiliary subunit
MQIIKKPFIALVLTFVIIGLSNYVDLRKDMTIDQRYTLSEGTISYLNTLDTPVRIDIFLSGDLPGMYRDLRRELDVFLNQLKFYTGPTHNRIQRSICYWIYQPSYSRNETLWNGT